MSGNIHGFTDGQQAAWDAIMDGRNVFLTGDAGTGKSYVLERCIEEWGRRDRSTLVMAPTGIAAINVGGVTIHRGLGLMPQVFEPGYAPYRTTMAAAQTVVIDEISMVGQNLFDVIARMFLDVARVQRGKQIILVGDFHQLPPVVGSRDYNAICELYPDNPTQWAFKSSMWKTLGLEPHVLHEVVRQDDADFQNALTMARDGDMSCAGYFNGHSVASRKTWKGGGIELASTNADATRWNDEALEALGNPICTIDGDVEGKVAEGDKAAPQTLRLAVGARVMSVRNDKMGRYQNGSMGEVVDIRVDCVRVAFDNGETCDIEPFTWDIGKSTVRSDGERKTVETETIGSYTQFPLKLAWAITIHKSQGQTFDSPVLVHTSVFAPGQLYVALSRCRRFDDLTITPKIAQQRQLSADHEVTDFYESLETGADYGDDEPTYEELMRFYKANKDKASA